MVKRGLGKGFESLIPTDILNSDFDTTAAEDERVSDIRIIKVSDIEPDPEQPRRFFDKDELFSLAKSIEIHGILQPIVVTARGNKYQIVAGERRWRAASIAGLDKIPAIIRTLSSQHKLELSVIENAQRSDLNPLETATAFLKLRTQFNLSDKDISDRVGKAPSTIANVIRLLKLPDDAKDALLKGDISEGHARQILAIDDPKVQKHLLDQIIKHKWSVATTERFVVGYKNGGKSGLSAVDGAHKTARTETDFTRNLAKKLGFKSKSVLHKTTAHGGQIIIKYRTQAEMDRVGKILGIK